jgi:endonuclease III
MTKQKQTSLDGNISRFFGKKRSADCHETSHEARNDNETFELPEPASCSLKQSTSHITHTGTSNEVQKGNDQSTPHPSSPEIPTTDATKLENPFAAFAFRESKESTSSLKKSSILTWKKTMPEKTTAAPKSKRPRTTGKTTDWVKMHDISSEEQHRVISKWHSLADENAPLEVRRFQVLIAARLHARCQEPTVRKAIKSLREILPELSVDQVAKADPEVLAAAISNLQFFNVKAQQIVKAAQQIQSQFGGSVPEDEHSLLQITGVGKVFADLLAFVNTRSAHGDTSPPT